MSLRVCADSQVVLRVCTEALAMIAGDVRTEPDRVIGRTGWSWRSWGEEVVARVEPDQIEGGVRVRVESLSLLRFVQFDWGKNLSNERRLYRLIQEGLEAAVPGATVFPPSSVGPTSRGAR